MGFINYLIIGFGLIALTIQNLITNKRIDKINSRLDNLETNRIIADRVIRELQASERVRQRIANIKSMAYDISTSSWTKEEVQDYLEKHINI
jgi:hypothetical protein